VRKAVKVGYKARPGCFGTMYKLSESEICDRCVLGGCRHFNDCEKWSASRKATNNGPAIPMEIATDHEYRIRW